MRAHRIRSLGLGIWSFELSSTLVFGGMVGAPRACYWGSRRWIWRIEPSKFVKILEFPTIVVVGVSSSKGRFFDALEGPHGRAYVLRGCIVLFLFGGYIGVSGFRVFGVRFLNSDIRVLPKHPSVWFLVQALRPE